MSSKDGDLVARISRLESWVQSLEDVMARKHLRDDAQTVLRMPLREGREWTLLATGKLDHDDIALIVGVLETLARGHTRLKIAHPEPQEGSNG